MAKLHLHKDRVMFWCPGCRAMMQVCPLRWHWNGDIVQPTLSPSIKQTTGPFPDGHVEICHCFIHAGDIKFCDDCTHSLAGQTLPLPDLEDKITIIADTPDRFEWVRKS